MTSGFSVFPLRPAVLLLVAGFLPGQTPLYTFDGDGAGDQLGYSVSSAGDVNDDGFADLVVGAPFDDNSGTDAGMVRVLSGADGSVLWSVDGAAAGDNFGWSVGAAGDVDGDGKDDVIVGAPLADANGMDSGTARVLSGVDGSTIYTFTGDAAGDNFGWSVRGAGDANGDGYADLIVGAPLANTNGNASGMARVFAGKDGSTLRSFDGDSAGDHFGWSVSGAGDADADGYDDVVVGAPLDNNNGNDSGMVRVLSVNTGLALWSANGDGGDDHFGWSVARAGDANADGKADVVAGAPFDDNRATDSGSARILSGLDGSELRTVNGDLAGENLGWSVGGAGDVDGDGVADVITGSPLYGATAAGRACVWSGKTGLRLWTVKGAAAGDNLGWSVDIAGDADGDGFFDLVAGAPLADNHGADSGSAVVLARKPFDTLIDFKKLAPAQSPGLFGNDNRQVGDVNADGIEDFAIGAVSDVGAQGTVRVYSGADQSVLYTFVGGLNNIFYGPVVGKVGDVDGDGYDDVFTGAQHYKVTEFEGRATLRSGKTGNIIWQWFGVQQTEHMGSALGSISDIDGDGVPDLFVGLLKHNLISNGTPGVGMVRVYSGGTGQPIWEVEGTTQGDWFSSRGENLGDLDGDGFDDFVLGAPQAASIVGGAGYAVVLSGIDGHQIWRVNGVGAGDVFGWTVAAPGDVDGDGFDDFLVGANGYDPPGQLNAGMARLYSGKTGTMIRQHIGELAGDSFGEALNGAGDVDGDGYPDYIIGAPGADPGGLPAAGTATLYSGQDGSVIKVFTGKVVLGVLGKGCSGIGDANHDGYDDVQAGAIQDSSAGAQSGAEYLYQTTTKSNPGSFDTYGAACLGSNGKLPKVKFGGRPVLASSFDVKVTGGPATTLAVLGFDSAKQNIPLGFIGAPGCTFWALPLIAVNTATDAEGKSSLTLPVPNDVTLVGATLYVQWILKDAGANQLTFILSDGGRVTLGNP